MCERVEGCSGEWCVTEWDAIVGFEGRPSRLQEVEIMRDISSGTRLLVKPITIHIDRTFESSNKGLATCASLGNSNRT